MSVREIDENKITYQKPRRIFENSGSVNTKEAYYVPLDNVTNTLNQDIKTMVDQGRYFSIFAPRQSGKTTFLKVKKVPGQKNTRKTQKLTQNKEVESMRWILTLVIFIFTIGVFGTPGACRDKYEINLKKPKKNCDIIEAKIAKWYNNHTAAVSITYDDGSPISTLNQRTNKFVIQNGLTMDYEIVTKAYLHLKYNREYLLKELIPAGFGYFGHGHKHINHDKLSYDGALQSFKRCYKVMKNFGLKPVAYAYPMGAAMEQETRKALADAGFLSGRLHYSTRMTAPYIIPDSQLEPEDWYALPTLVMQDYAFNRCIRCVNNNKQLIPYLDKTIDKKAWIILTYHAIGNEKGYGFFKYEEFKKNMYAIKNRDFWVASMNAVTLYIRERMLANIKMVPVLNHAKEIQEIQLSVSDGLPNDIYDQPLTILFDLPESWVNKSIALVEGEKILETVLFGSIKGMISIQPNEVQRKLVKVDGGN
jgi:hypothetical protein